MDSKRVWFDSFSDFSMRPETGPMEFEDDWRGIFIRGDSALMGYLPWLNIAIEKLKSNDDGPLITMQLEALAQLLESANHHDKTQTPQKLKKFIHCLR